MIRIRKKGSGPEEAKGAKQIEKPEGEDSAYVGAHPGKPWEKLTNIHHGRGSRIKFLTEEEQKEVVEIAKQYFEFKGKDYPKARTCIQEKLDKPGSQQTETFFSTAPFLKKRLLTRAYLSNSEGRFISHNRALQLLKYFAEAALDFEIGAVDYYIDDNQKTELIVGDGNEVVSENGYWFSHTHPAKKGVTSNFLPSTQDLDVILLTARAYAQHLAKLKTEYFVLRDIGSTKISVETSIEPPPSQAKIEFIELEYSSTEQPDKSIDNHLKLLKMHLRTRHNIPDEKIEIISTPILD
jgi:hypothetical protein